MWGHAVISSTWNFSVLPPPHTYTHKDTHVHAERLETEWPWHRTLCKRSPSENSTPPQLLYSPTSGFPCTCLLSPCASHIDPPGRASTVWSASGPKPWCWHQPGLLLRTKSSGALCQMFRLKVKPSSAAPPASLHPDHHSQGLTACAGAFRFF